MALDVYVMPLWRFKAGDFTSPIEETLGIKPTIIALEDPPVWSPPWIHFTPRRPTRAQRRILAVEQVDALKSQLAALTSTPVDWLDDGIVRYNKQYHHPITLRTFAAWCDHRDEWPEFTAPPERDYHKHPIWKLPKPGHRRFPMLTAHSLHTGYFFPVPFEGHYQVEPFKVANHWEFFHDVASTQTVQRELSELLEFMAAVPDVRDEAHGSSPVGDARWYAEELQRICALSIEHALPVIFYG